MEGIMGSELVAPPSVIPLPAPVWFLLLFKVLGFALHIVPMSLWFAGLPLALGMMMWGGEMPRRAGARLLRQMPIIVAFGINLGIVPLLFTQVLFHRVFYPATILMAWPWLSIIALLIAAYYLVYAVAQGLKRDGDRLGRAEGIAGWLATLLFLGIGMLFTTGFQNMTLVDDWPAMWSSAETGGAVLGVAANHGNPVTTVRWMMVFGLALMTTAVWFVFDAGVLARGDDALKRWAPGYALKVFVAGLVVFGALGAVYAFSVMPETGRESLFQGAMIPLTVLAAVSPVGVLALLWLGRGLTPMSLGIAALAGQFGVVLINAMSRQAVQIAELAPFMQLSTDEVRVQLSPLLLFLVLFVAGLALVAWLIARCVREVTESSDPVLTPSERARMTPVR